MLGGGTGEHKHGQASVPTIKELAGLCNGAEKMNG